MNSHEHLSVSDFARLSRASRQTLYHYDKIGLLSPVSRGDNGYRFYSIKQLAICNTIRILHKLDVPLNEIRDLLSSRTPELAEDVLVRQIGSFGERQSQMAQAQMLLHILLHSLRSGLKSDTENVSIQYFPAEQIILGEINDYSNGRNAYDALYSFYQTMSDKRPLTEVDICYPVWGILSEERVRKGNWGYPDRYYFYNPAGQDQRPGALYAVGYMRAGYGKGAKLYERMVDYIGTHEFEICGDAYEEYPINEVGVADPENYLMRVLITVREKTP